MTESNFNPIFIDTGLKLSRLIFGGKYVVWIKIKDFISKKAITILGL